MRRAGCGCGLLFDTKLDVDLEKGGHSHGISYMICFLSRSSMISKTIALIFYPNEALIRKKEETRAKEQERNPVQQ